MSQDQDKYYVPDISEFHVGFRYEQMNGMGSVGYWETFEHASHDDLGIDIECYLDRVRVKFLDRSDIEELGWKYEKTQKYASDETYDTYSANNKVNLLHVFVDSHLVEIEKWGQWSYEKTLFTGTIRNYNELKTLMKWLGIK